MVKINCPLLGISVLVVLKEFMNNPHLHLIPELNSGPTGSNGTSYGFFERKASQSLAFQRCNGITTCCLAAADFSRRVGLVGITTSSSSSDTTGRKVLRALFLVLRGVERELEPPEHTHEKNTQKPNTNERIAPTSRKGTSCNNREDRTVLCG